MAWYRAGGGGGGVPASLKSDMNAVFNKKFGTSTDYPPTVWPDDVNLMGPLPKGKASGAIAHITDGADDVPTSSCEVEIAPTLTGVSSVSVVRQGENLLNFPDFTLNFGTTDSEEVENTVNFPAGQYTVTFDVPTNTATKTVTFVIRDKKGVGATQQAISYISAGSTTSKTLTFTATMPFNYFYCYMASSETTGNTITIENIMMVSGATSSPYVAPTVPTVSTVNLGRTIYGGNVDIVNGTGTDDSILIELDGSDDESYSGSGNRIALTSYSSVIVKNTANNTTIKGDYCDSFPQVTNDNTYSGVLGFSVSANDTTYIYFSDGTGNMTAEAFRAWLQNNPIKMILKIRNSTDFTFTGVEVPTRLGVNNFFSDVGDTSVEYRKDINLAIGLNKYRYLKWKISATRTTSSYCQMSDIEFTDANNNKFTFPTGTTVTASTSATSGSSPAYIVDGNTATKFCGNWVTGGITLNIDLGMGNVIDVSVYKNFSWYTANDATDRDPKTWELYGIDNANNEILLCSRDYTPTTDRKALADTVTITPLE